jgi:hypothetical protein
MLFKIILVILGLAVYSVKGFHGFIYRERTSRQGPILRLKFINIYLYCLLLCPSLKFMKERRNPRLEICSYSEGILHGARKEFFML